MPTLSRRSMLICSAAAATAGWVRPGPARAEEFDHDHGPWSDLLRRHIRWNQGRTATTVDYAGFKADRAALGGYLDALSAVPEAAFQGWDKERQLAFLINAYNAYTVELILTGYPGLKSIKELGSLLQSPWSKPFFRLLGKPRTLDDVEHRLIRGRADFDEPRIHFAVNCASIGCPALRDEAFRAGDLDRQLQEQTVSFLSDRSRNWYSAEDNALYVSQIFDWYGDDFALGWRGAATLRAFLSLYATALDLAPGQSEALAKGSLRIRYADYDWALNATG